MKFSILSGAYVNAGDFLIVDRTIQLLKNVYPDCEIIIYERRKNLENDLKEINKSDALILAGGPAYLPNVYPETIPLVDDLDRITTKIVAIGLGWYGKNTSNKYIYEEYKFSESTKKLFNRIIKDSGYLTCRDWYSVRALRANGINNAIMTGCPAWYNLEYIDKSEIRENISMPIKKICISDPANIKNFEQALKVVEYVKQKFTQANISFVFHRIEKNDEIHKNLKQKLEEIGIKIVNISNSVDGFSVYDDCDLHIGYRVHAHIYNLSNRNISILIEEDGRGAGVNQALGLTTITAYEDNATKIFDKSIFGKIYRLFERKILKIGVYKNNPYILEQLEDAFNMLIKNDFSIYKTAFFNMQMYYKIMENHIKNILKN